jgi:hypothetical protein
MICRTPEIGLDSLRPSGRGENEWAVAPDCLSRGCNGDLVRGRSARIRFEAGTER